MGHDKMKNERSHMDEKLIKELKEKFMKSFGY